MKWETVKPVAKVERSAFAGAIATVGWWIGEVTLSLDPPAAVVAASVVILMALVGWLAPK